MSAQTAGWLGFLAGLLVATVMVLSTLMHYVARDMDSFMRWLDNKDGGKP